MVRGRNTKGMVGLLLLFLPAIAQCAPTLSDHGRGAVADGHRFSSPEETKHLRMTAHVTGLAHSQLLALAREFHKHPVISVDKFSSANGIKSFPPLPSSLLMASTGFMCISLVRDRRLWLTAFMYLLWTGQAGFSLLPRLAFCIAGEGYAGQRRSDRVAEPRRSARMAGDLGGIAGAYCVAVPGRLNEIADHNLSALGQLSVRSPKVPTASDRRAARRLRLRGDGPSVSAVSRSRTRVDRRSRPLQPIIGRPGAFEVSTADSLPLASGPVERLATGLIRTNLARGPPVLRPIAHLLHLEG